MKRSPLLCIAAVALLFSSFMLEGCNFDQGKVSAAVSRIGSLAEDTRASLPAAAPILRALALTEPDIAAALGPIAEQADTALSKLSAACAAYAANPGSTEFQAVLNFSDAVVAQVDQAALKIAGIKDPASQRKAAAWISGVAAGFHVLYAVIKSYASGAQVKAMPKIAHVQPEKIRPLLDRVVMSRELSALGYDPDVVMHRAGL